MKTHMVRNVGTKHGNMAYAYTGTLIWIFTFINIETFNENKYRTFKGDRKMYGPMPHSNETDRLCLTFTVLI